MKKKNQEHVLLIEYVFNLYHDHILHMGEFG